MRPEGLYLLAVVEEVVRQVIANVAENAAAKHGCGSIPVVEEDCVCKLPKRGGKN